MKKILIYIFLIILWWFLGGLLSVTIVNLSPESYLFSNKFIYEHSIDIYLIIIMIPFIISNMISAFITAILAKAALYYMDCWRIGLMLSIFGSTPFVILTSYEDKFVFLLYKILVMGVFVFVFGWIGALLGGGLRRKWGVDSSSKCTTPEGRKR